MDESMNSVHSISAMDISPASSPRFVMNAMPSDHSLLHTFHQQQELLSNVLLNPVLIHDKPIINKNPLSDDYDMNSKSMCLYSTVLTENNDGIQTQILPDESSQLRQRTIPTTVSSAIESPPTKLQSTSSKRSFQKLSLLIIPIVFLIVYLISQFFHTSILQPRVSHWQNASEYLMKNLVGQEQGLQEFQQAVEKHNNFSIVLIEGSMGTGKSYLASSLEKFLPTSLISANTLLGLPAHHWTDSNRLSSYLSSSLSPSAFQFLILDDLDLLTNNEQYCQTLTNALQSLDHNKNIFILLLHTQTIPNPCQEYFTNTITASIKFNMLKRDHIKICVENEAYTQNVQPPLADDQREKILNSLEYIDKQGVLYSLTGCKQIPSMVMLTSKRSHSVNYSD